MIIDKQVEKMKQDVADLEEKLESVERKNIKLQARRRKKENEISYQNRKQRAHRLIGIGVEVESVMGRQIPKEDLPAFREYLKTAERKIGAFNVVDGRCSFIPLTEFDWNDNQGPVGKSYDLLGDGSIELINIPGHADGLFAVKVKNEEGKYVLLFSDGGYARKSWEEMITSGIAADKTLQKQSLAWIREQSMDENCVESLANHDPDIEPHVIEL